MRNKLFTFTIIIVSNNTTIMVGNLARGLKIRDASGQQSIISHKTTRFSLLVVPNRDAVVRKQWCRTPYIRKQPPTTVNGQWGRQWGRRVGRGADVLPGIISRKKPQNRRHRNDRPMRAGASEWENTETHRFPYSHIVRLFRLSYGYNNKWSLRAVTNG